VCGCGAKPSSDGGVTEDLAPPPSRRQALTLGLGLAILMIALDQATKHLIVYVVMDPPRLIEVTSFFNLVLGWNRGVSFGMFNTASDYGPLILSGLALLIVAGLIFWMARAETKWTAIALGLIVGGALGNVIDRGLYGAVVDFLDFHVFGYHWPAFNVADTAICIGAALLILESLFAPRDPS
jgi:signal peptidase II